MAIRSVRLEGRLTHERKSVFQFPVGDIEKVTTGRWQFAISSLTFFFKEGQGLQPWNSVFELSSNFIDTVVPHSSGKVREQMPLAIVRVRGNPGENIVIGFKWRDYFEATCPKRLFELTWEELSPYENVVPPAPGQREVYVYALLLFRRVE